MYPTQWQEIAYVCPDGSSVVYSKVPCREVSRIISDGEAVNESQKGAPLRGKSPYKSVMKPVTLPLVSGRQGSAKEDCTTEWFFCWL